MFPYWFLFSLFAVGAVANRSGRPLGSAATPMLILASLVAALMIGLRFEIGSDWFNYMVIFDVTAYMRLGEILVSSDPGYLLLNWLGAQLGWGIGFVNIVCGLLFVWGLIRFATQQPNPWLAVLVAVPYLMIVVAMGYARQGVAIGIALVALVAFQRGQMIRFGVYILLAAAFHKSAIVILPLVGLAAVRYRIFIYGGIITLGTLLFWLFLDLFLSQIMQNYIGAEMESSGAAVRVVMNVVPAAIYLVWARRFATSDVEHKLWRNFSIAAFATLLFLVVSPSSTAVDRVALYLIPLQLFVLSRLPYAFPDQGRANVQLVLAVILYSAAIQFVWLNLAAHSNDWLPYKILPLL